MFPNGTRKSASPNRSMARTNNVCSNRAYRNEACDIAAFGNVEEWRFSAASGVISDVGFSPRGRNLPLAGVLIAMALLIASALPFSVQAQKPAGANVTADLPPGPMQAKATTTCLECHEARIILQQRLSKAAWGKEVDKMTKWGAVVDPADRDALIDYLSTNFSPDKPPYEPQRTAERKSGALAPR